MPAITKYTPEIALDICEQVSEGEILDVICTGQNGYPKRRTFHRWCIQFPDLAKAYSAARELSALALEEEALGLARKLKAGGADITGVKVRAFEVAMAQFRWSAIRRDPKRYGAGAEKSSAVNIQINTTLDLGADGSGAPSFDGQATYSITAQVPVEAPEEDDTVTPEEMEREARPRRDPLQIPHDPLANTRRGRKVKSPAKIKEAATRARKKAEQNGTS